MQIVLLLQLLAVAGSFESRNGEEDTLALHLRQTGGRRWIRPSNRQFTSINEPLTVRSNDSRHLRPKKQAAQATRTKTKKCNKRTGCAPPPSAPPITGITPTLHPLVPLTDPPTVPSTPPPTIPSTPLLTTIPPSTNPPTPPPTLSNLSLTCASSVPITVDTGTILGSINASSNAIGESARYCVYHTFALRSWFSLNGTGDAISISTCSPVLNFDSGIVVSSGSCDDQQCLVAAGYYDYECTLTTKTATRIVLRTDLGVTYFIVVEGLTASSPVHGQFALTVSKLQAPSNDECSGAVQIQPNDPPIIGSIANASSMYGTEYFCPDYMEGASVWYVMAGTDSVVTVTTCSQELDHFYSTLFVAKGTCDNLECVAKYNEVACSSTSGTAARVVFRTEPNVNYFIVVRSPNINSGSRGQFALTASTIEPVPNDMCSDAVILQPNTTIPGTITDATGDSSLCRYSNITPSVWYKLDGTGDVYEFSTCSPELNFDSAISVSSGSCANQECLISAISNNDGCPVNNARFRATTVSLRTHKGVIYFIAVEGYDNPVQGVFQLSAKTIEPVPNTVCSKAVTLQPDTTIQGVITSFYGDNGPCAASRSSSIPVVWYTLQGTGAAYEISTCSAGLNFSSAISISSGTCTNQQCIVHCIANNVDCPGSSSPYGAASIVLRTTAGESYFIAVEGLSSPVNGIFAIRVTSVTPPSNDLCFDAILVPSDNSTVTGSTTNATFTRGTVPCSDWAEFEESQDVWYRVQGTGGNLTASFCDPATTFVAQLAVYASGPGTNQCDQSCIAIDFRACDFANQASWSTQVGVDYLIRVFGYGNSFGSFGLRVFPDNSLVL